MAGWALRVTVASREFSSVQFIHSVQFKMIFFHAGKGPALSTQSLKSVPDVAVETVH